MGIPSIYILLSAFALVMSVHPVRASLIEEVRGTYIPGVVITQSVDHRGHHPHSCQVSEVTLDGVDPVGRRPRNVYLKYYESLEATRSRGSMIIVPPLRGVNILDRENAKSLCKRGISTALIDSWDFDSEPGLSWGNEDRGAIRAISAIRNVVEYLSYKASGPIGILGTSQGAVLASFVLAVDPLVNVGTLIDAGSPTSAILAKSQNSEVLKLKYARMKHYGIRTDEEYENILSRNIRINGLTLARESADKTILMFIATKDTRVPLQTQMNLWNAWNRPASVFIPLDHVPSIIRTSLRFHKTMMAFLLKHLG